MDRKFSLAYLTIPGTDPVTHIQIAAETGYDSVSLRTIPMHLPCEPEYRLEKDEKLFNSIKAALREYGLRVMDIELARIKEEVDINEFAPAFEAAAKLGATDVLGSVWSRNRSWYTDTVGRVAAMAKQFGLSYNVEFLPWAGVRNLQEAITLVDRVGCDNLYIMVDTLHAGRAGVTAQELKRTNQRYFRFMHLCDGPAGSDGDPVLDDIKDELMIFTAREARCYVGQGCMDVAGMVAAIPGVPLSIELPNDKELAARGARGHAQECLDTAKNYLKANGVH